MLNIPFGKRFGRCDGVTRRDFLQVGGLGVLGLSMADLLRAQARAGSSKRKKSVILYWMDGGPTHMETYDPKPDAPAEYRGPFGVTRTNVPGVYLNELLVGHARVMDRIALLRSVHHNNGDHFAAAHWMLTGYLGSTAANRTPKFPSFPAIVSRIKGPNAPGVPPYVAVPYAMTVGIRPGYLSATYLGVAYNPYDVNSDPNNPNFRVRNLNLPSGVTVERLQNRRTLLRTLDKLQREADTTGTMVGVDRFNQKAFEIITGRRAREAFDINREDPRTRDRYGRHVYGQSALLARRLVEAGVTCVAIHNGGWDHHSNIESGMKSRLPTFDQSVSALIEDLDQRGLLDDVIVCVMGEFGRTPRVNGNAGRDHWGNVMSVMLAGGGIRGGQVVGASNPKGEFPVDRPLKPADVIATIYKALGIDLDTHFVDHAGRPTSINNYGTPIEELL